VLPQLPLLRRPPPPPLLLLRLRKLQPPVGQKQQGTHGASNWAIRLTHGATSQGV
jgi:hypothetical protein